MVHIECKDNSWLGCLFNENASRKACIFLYVGYGNRLAEWKSLYVPSWKETLAIGKGVVGDYKSEESH